MNGDRLPTPRTVLVFRALMLGDLLCATPALRALREAWPQAHIALLGLPWARPLAARLPTVDEFIEFPGWPGLPERALPDSGVQQRLVAQMRERRFDLALQLHGSGAVVNPLVGSFGARSTAGFASGADWPAGPDAEHFTAWPTHGTEVERLLQLTDHLGLPRRGLALDFPLTAPDRDAAARLLPALGPLAQRPLAIVHAGSQLPSRRWPPERFAAVADALHEAGLAVVLTGSAEEAGLTQAVAQAMRTPTLDLAGATTLWTLGALVERAALVLSNDTGISHIAAALGTASVVISSGGDAARWAPADAARHRVFWQDLPCRPCAYAHCPIGHPCALAVEVDSVRQAALRAASPAVAAAGEEAVSA